MTNVIEFPKPKSKPKVVQFPLIMPKFYSLRRRKVVRVKNLNDLDHSARYFRVRHHMYKGHRISTVFLPVEHPGGKFFETAIFDRNDEITIFARACTHRDALRCHQAAKRYIDRELT